MLQRKKFFTAFMMFVALVCFLLGSTSCDVCLQCPNTRLLRTSLPNDTLAFSDVPRGQTRSLSFRLFNQGTALLHVSAHSITQDPKDAFSSSSVQSFNLRPGVEHGITITVQYKSSDDFETSAQFNIISNATNTSSQGNFVVHLQHKLTKGRPALDCPGGLDFGAVKKFLSKKLGCKLTNKGAAPFIISKALYTQTEGSYDAFRLVEPRNFPLTLHPDASQTLEIEYSPPSTPQDKDQGIFRFITKDPEGSGDSNFALAVTARTALPKIQLAPYYGACDFDQTCQDIDPSLYCSQNISLNESRCLPRVSTNPPTLLFPFVAKGKTIRRQFSIRSTGDLPLEVSQIRMESGSSFDFRIDPLTLPKQLTLKPKEEIIATIEYSPSDEKEDVGSITFEVNTYDQKRNRLQLKALSRGCDLEISPEPQVGIPFEKPSEKTLTLRNTGNEDCVIHKVNLKRGAPFTLSFVPPSNQRIPPNHSISLKIRLEAQDEKEHLDHLELLSNDSDRPRVSIPLYATAICKTGCDKKCVLEATPSPLFFPKTPVARKRSLSVRLLNRGHADCVIQTPFEIQSPQDPTSTVFSLGTLPSFPLTLPPAGVHHLEVNYTPTKDLSRDQAELLIQSNDEKTPTLKVPLDGSSGQVCLDLLTHQVNFGSSQVHCSALRHEISLFHLGLPGCPTTIQLNNVTLLKGTSREFEIRKVTYLPKTLAAGEGTTISLNYKPIDVGDDFGILEIETDLPIQSKLSIPLIGKGVNTNEHTDVFQQISVPKVDILFVVDNSCSMFEEQSNLVENAKAFIQWALTTTHLDYHIAVTTTDTTSATHPPGCAHLGSGSSTRIITPSTIDPISVFQANIRVGTRGPSSKKGLEAAYKALIPPTSIDPNCNLGFSRLDASLSLIFVSDSPDQSPLPAASYVSYLKGIKGFRNLDKIRANAIVGPAPSGCMHPKTGNAQYAPRYIEATTQLNGLNLSICSSDWFSSLTRLGAISFGLPKQFFLSQIPNQASIVVKAEGQLVPQSPYDGWVYNPYNNSILFSASRTPMLNAKIEVSYKTLCLP